MNQHLNGGNATAADAANTTEAHIISAMEARKRFGQILEETFYRGDTFIIERSGRPMAVIVPIETYARLGNDALPTRSIRDKMP